MARNSEERLDIASYEGLNSVGFFAGGLILNKALNRVFQKEAKNALKLSALGQTAKKHAEKTLTVINTSKSLAMYSLLSGFMFSVPYIRNWLTATVTHRNNFDNLLLEKNPPSSQLSENPKSDGLDQEKKSYRATATKALGLSAMTALGFTGAGKLILSKPKLLKYLPEIPRVIKEKLLLGVDKDSKLACLTKIPDLGTLIVWIGASYAGTISASRGKTERNEQWMKAASFVTCFSVLPQMIAKTAPKLVETFKPKLRNAAKKEAIQDVAYITKLFSQVALLTASTFGYQRITKRRLESQLNTAADNSSAVKSPVLLSSEPSNIALTSSQIPSSPVQTNTVTIPAQVKTNNVGPQFYYSSPAVTTFASQSNYAYQPQQFSYRA
ncbi:MAG: hypothetical protein AAGI66_04435 [Cyanobacteria bacterium P01_H01_bin.74]